MESERSYSEQQFSAAAWEANFRGASFYDCHFENCIWLEADLRACRFVSCRFDGCDLSLADITDALFQETHFEGCKLVGLNWSLAAHRGPLPLGVGFKKCVLDFAAFKDMALKEVSFVNSSFREASFANVALRGASFAGADLERCTFIRCDLSEADFRGAKGYRFGLESNVLRGARFSFPEVLALLQELGIVIE